MHLSRRNIIVGVLTVLVLAVIASRFAAAPKNDNATRRGMQWLLNYNEPFRDPGILWTLDRTNVHYCNSATLSNFIPDRFREFDASPIERGYRKFIDPAYAYNLDMKLIEAQGKQYDEILLPALYCTTTPLMASTTEKIQALVAADGYDRTHAFLALQIIKDNQCMTTIDIPSELEKTSTALALEESKSGFDDLFAERVAFLEYGGFRDHIDPAWIETIRKNQLRSGAWPNPQIFALPEDPHTTALAVWSLAQYENKCPL